MIRIEYFLLYLLLYKPDYVCAIYHDDRLNVNA